MVILWLILFIRVDLLSQGSEHFYQFSFVTMLLNLTSHFDIWNLHLFSLTHQYFSFSLGLI